MEWRQPETDAVAAMRNCRAALWARGSTVVAETLGSGSDKIVDWRHYPDGDAYDSTSHVQYFFHRHPEPRADRGQPDGRPREHGHFHLFLRGEGMPAGVLPLVLPEVAVANAPPPRQSAPLKRGHRDEVSHLVAISVDAGGEPIRLFTTNRWVTGETWYRADDVIAMLPRVRFAAGGSSSLVDCWLEALVRLFRPEITVLLRNRDKAIAEWRWRWPRGNAFEDPRLEVASSFEIDLEARLDAPCEAATPAIAARRRLSSMAEGWGA